MAVDALALVPALRDRLAKAIGELATCRALLIAHDIPFDASEFSSAIEHHADVLNSPTGVVAAEVSTRAGEQTTADEKKEVWQPGWFSRKAEEASVEEKVMGKAETANIDASVAEDTVGGEVISTGSEASAALCIDAASSVPKNEPPETPLVASPSAEDAASLVVDGPAASAQAGVLSTAASSLESSAPSAHASMPRPVSPAGVASTAPDTEYPALLAREQRERERLEEELSMAKALLMLNHVNLDMDFDRDDQTAAGGEASSAPTNLKLRGSHKLVQLLVTLRQKVTLLNQQYLLLRGDMLYLNHEMSVCRHWVLTSFRMAMQHRSHEQSSLQTRYERLSKVLN